MKYKYLTFRHGAWRLDKRNEGKRFSASFDNLEDALNIRDIYIEHDWNIPLTTPQLFFQNNVYYILYKPDKQLKILLKTPNKTEAEQFLQTYTDTQYIQHVGNKYRLQKTIGDDYVWFGSYNTLEEAIKYRDIMRQHNWDTEYFEKIYKESESVQNRYIYKSRGKYIVSRTWDDIQRTYGSYDTIEEAREKRDELIQNNWEQPTERFLIFLFNKWWVKKDHRKNGHGYMSFYCYAEDRALMERARDYYIEHGFPEKPLFTTDVLRYIRKNGDNYYLEKIHHDRKTTYPCGNSLTNAIALRDILEQHNWNPPLNEYKHGGRIYSLDIENDKYTLSVVDDIPITRYIYQKGESYVLQHKGFWGTYKTRREAVKMRDILINYKWNRELYNNIYKWKTDEYIYYYGTTYLMNNREHDIYSHYKTMDYARIMRDYFSQHNWRIDYDEYITETSEGYLLQVSIPPFFEHSQLFQRRDCAEKRCKQYIYHGVDGMAQNKYIKTFKDGYAVRKMENGKDIIVSTYTSSIEDARLMRDILFDNNWELPPEGEYDYYGKSVQLYHKNGKISLKPKQYILRKQYTRKQDWDIPMNIRRACGKYEVVKYLDGHLRYFGRYDTLDEAVAMKEDFIQHDWSLEYYHSIRDRRHGRR